jgi:nitroreductase
MKNSEYNHTLTVILKRRSCRQFRDEDIPENHVLAFVEALRWAPSAGNRQPWHFYVVSAQETKSNLAAAAYGQNFIAQAPLDFVICALPQESASRYGSRGELLYAIQDTAAATQNLLLVTTDYGYGSCWVGAFDELRVRRVLSLPENHKPVAIVPVGKPDEYPAETPRKNPEDIVTFVE